MIEPSVIVLYVEDVHTSSAFYQELLGKAPQEASPTYHSFKLSNGMSLGLKAKQMAEPPVEANAHSELAFTLQQNKNVDELFVLWQKKMKIAQVPITVPYGYTFVALDPDNNRLRVVALGQ